ncbi:hypothetical protein KP509_12G065500 [Ceratopteris richardii]|uniref:CTCHY-type domain-containing protein n=1 Tax=Ceratopteris richardii TaxID=49495 RepID=A0A8T2TSZ0_CERRI|nr:hypothetical protein KP509_12G065500 [Ceratopteris richardii]
MGEYFYSKCKFFDDDVSKQHFHCDKCGICRLGGCTWQRGRERDGEKKELNEVIEREMTPRKSALEKRSTDGGPRGWKICLIQSLQSHCRERERNEGIERG